MRGTDLIGYAYDAALYCVECTVARHKAGGFTPDRESTHDGLDRSETA